MKMLATTFNIFEAITLYKICIFYSADHSDDDILKVIVVHYIEENLDYLFDLGCLPFL